MGTGNKDEVMDFKGSLGWRSKGKDKRIDGTDEGTGCSRSAQEHNERNTLMLDELFTFRGYRRDI